MERTNLSLIKDTPTRSELAIAISEASKARAVVDQKRAAAARARDMVERAEQDLEAAQAKLKIVQQANAERMLAIAQTGKPMTPDRSIREARAEIMDGEDALAAARTTKAVTDREAADAEYVLDKAAKKAADAARDVVRDEKIGAFLAEAREMQMQLGLRRVVLKFLKDECLKRRDPALYTDNWDDVRNSKDENEPLRKDIESYLADIAFPIEFDHVAASIQTVTAPWRDAIAALERNSDASLPPHIGRPVHS